MQTGSDDLRLVDVRELSRLLGISPRQCWRLTAMAEAGRGDIPRPLRLGTRTVRWRLRAVEAYLDGLAERAEAVSLRAVERETGVPNPVLSRFLRGRQSLRLAYVERLCEYLGIAFTMRRPKGRRQKGD